jgi:hypothetical protein
MKGSTIGVRRIILFSGCVRMLCHAPDINVRFFFPFILVYPRRRLTIDCVSLSAH